MKMQSRDPSAWSERLPAVILALIGAGIATYLALYQVGVLPHVWEPFFGDGSHFILKESTITRLLHPVPDAALGAAAYLIEAVCGCLGGRQRWRTWPLAVFATGAVALGLFLAGIGLVLSQAFWFRAYCTLCLASAACSVLIFAQVAPEVWAAWRHHRGIAGRSGAQGEFGTPAAH